MPLISKETLQERFRRLKKAFEKIIRNKKKQPLPSLVLQPVRQNNLRGTDQF